MRGHGRSAARGRGVVTVAALVAVLGTARPVSAERVAESETFVRRLANTLTQSSASWCLSPATTDALSAVAASGALQPVLQDEFTLLGANVQAQQIDIRIVDRAEHPYGVTLAVPGAKPGEPDGQGKRFGFYLLATPSPPNQHASAALLGIAALFDAAIPETALSPCGGRTKWHVEGRYPRALALTSAVAEVSIIVIAILFGLRAVRPGADNTSPPRSGGDREGAPHAG